jgi:hypothetical protein
MRLLLIGLGLSAALALPTLLTEPEKTTGHAENIYRGWRMNRLLARGQHCGVDLLVDAGQPFAPGLETAGRWAAWTVGSDAAGPNQDRYSISLRWCAALVPLLTLWSAMMIGSAAPFFAPTFAMSLWLLRPNIEIFDAGNVELTLLGPVIGVYLAGLRRLHRQPSLLAWLAVAVSSLLGWQLFPILWIIFFLPATAGWLAIAWQHSWLWHVMIVLAAVVGALPCVHGWNVLIRMGAVSGELGSTEFRRLWMACGESMTRLCALFGIHCAIAFIPWVTGRFFRQAAATIGLASVAVGVVSYLRPDFVHWDDISLPRILARPALPCGNLGWLLELAKRSDHSARTLCESTDNDAAEITSGFSVLLATHTPVLVGSRTDGEAVPWSFAGGHLSGRPFNDWTDDELARFFERWNVGWILCQSKETAARLGQYASAIRLSLRGVPDGIEVFAIDRKHRFVLKGQGQWLANADGSITLTDVIPEQGEVIVSLRYHSAWAVAAKPTVIEAEVDPYDPWPIMRLRLSEPVARLMLRRDRP